MKSTQSPPFPLLPSSPLLIGFTTAEREEETGRFCGEREEERFT